MYDYLEIYTDISLTLTMIITIVVYSVGLMQFLRPFTKSRPARYLTGAAYAAIMLVMFFLPQEFNNLVAYGAGVVGAFAVFTLLDRRNYAQKLFLAFSFFSVRWLTAAVGTSIWLKVYGWTCGFVIDAFVFEPEKQVAAYIVYDAVEGCIMAGIMLLLITIFHKVYVSKNEKMTIKEALLLMLPSVAGVFNYRLLLYFNSIDTREIGISPYDLVSFAFYIVSYTALVGVIYFYEQIKAGQRREKETAMLSVQTDNIRDYISGAESLYRDIRAIRHDMRNHLAVLESLHARGENEAFETYLAEARERIGSDKGVNSGDPVTDVILTEKQSEAARRAIAFECDFHYPDGFSAGALDMSIILNNALNNAIEAAEKCHEGERRIAITSLKKKNAFVITVTNTCTGECTAADGELPETTKPDRSEHGFGLVNIRNTAEKYGGGIDISCKGGEFTLTVMLMM